MHFHPFRYLAFQPLLSLALYCRSKPGDLSFPTAVEWSTLNSTVGGRVIDVVPSGQFCKSIGGCTYAQWSNSTFRQAIPGSMMQVNWEEDYVSNPPSLCFRNSSNCGQGNVPLFALNASSVEDIQAGVRFAQAHNLRLVIKASSHDYLGRSTAKNSLLIWTHYLRNITFHDSFGVGGKDQGSAVTVGSGASASAIYRAAEANGKIYIGPKSASTAIAGGYLQGGGHSAFSPLFGLASDNAFEFKIVLANGHLVTANSAKNPDLFWALRGGGAGSWGVIVSATFRTFGTFPTVLHSTVLKAQSAEDLARLGGIHAQHVFDFDSIRAGQYTFFVAAPPLFTLTLTTVFPNATMEMANSSIASFLKDASAAGFNYTVTVALTTASGALAAQDAGGVETILGSRLIPSEVYKNNTVGVQHVYEQLFSMNISVHNHIIGGGKVTENADLDTGINPKWREAKTHFFMPVSWSDSTAPEEVEALKQRLTHELVPLVSSLAGGPDSAAYSNEGDVREPNFQTTFFGSNYAKLRAIKQIYDPEGLFIVGAGVASDEWDMGGMCKL